MTKAQDKRGMRCRTAKENPAIDHYAISCSMAPMTGFSAYKDRFLGRNAAIPRDASSRYPLN